MQVDGVREGRVAGQQEKPVDEETPMTVVSLKQLCDALIDELAALGGEQMLFSHMKRAVARAAGKGDLQSLQATWKDLRVWTRGLTPQQQQDVADRMRLRCGVDLVDDERSAQDGQEPADPGGQLESEN
jgi:hypothetical protein